MENTNNVLNILWSGSNKNKRARMDNNVEEFFIWMRYIEIDNKIEDIFI